MSATDVLFLLVFLGLLALLAGAGVFLIRWYDRRASNRNGYGPAAFEAQSAAQQGASVEVEVGMRLEAVLDAAVEAMLQAGYRFESRTENTVTFAHYRGWQVACLGCVLMLIFIIPGLLYLIFAQKTARVTIAAYPIEGGSRLVIGGGFPEAVEVAARWARELPRPRRELEQRGSELPERSELQRTATETPDIPQQIRRLAELRDAGLITPEEFEAKKQQLLRRM